MVTVSGDTPAYRNMGELHFTDAEGNPIVLLCFVQEQAIKGHDDFALICSDTLVDMKADINYHAETSKQGNILPLKRLISQPYHYEDDSDTKGKLDLTNNKLLHSVATESSTNATEIAPGSTGHRTRQRSIRERRPRQRFNHRSNDRNGH